MAKRTIKSIMSIAMACVIAISCFGLIGCEKKDDGVTTVRIWTSAGATKEFMEKKVEEFNKNNSDVKIEYQVIASGLDDMTKSAFENNDGPEIFGGSQNAIKQYQRLGYAIPVEELDGGKEYVDNLAIDVPDNGYFLYDGKVYVYPTSSVTGGLVYNEDLFKEAGIVDDKGNAKAPETWEELYDACRKIKALGNGRYGIGIPMKDGFAWGYAFGWACSASSNGDVYDFENKKVEVSTGNMLNVVNQIKKDGTAFPGSESLDNDTLRLQFAEGNIGMFFGCSWDVGVLTDQFPAKCNWAVAPYPVLDKNDMYLQEGQASGTMSIGNSATKSPEMSKAVMKVYSWLYSDEMITELYEEMLSIPYDTSKIENADSSKFGKQWKQFCDLQKITRSPSKPIALKIEGDDMGIVCEKVWLGELTVDKAVKDLNKRYTEAFKKGIEDGTLVESDYTFGDYNREAFAIEENEK